ncbi:hypothetical protein [Terriglobus roseus]|uniref:hypothetical protein n=1 Tax=Terriglobus roseus TaxID=392734 RepID=UPI001BAF4360|nr:hypothetical protein [Terriglobus roseus]
MNENQSEGRQRRRGMSLASSGLVTALLLAVVLGVLGVVWQAHLHGKIHKMTTPEIAPDTVVAARPGGQDVLHMMRNDHAEEMTPKFSSALLLPGAGMAVLQANLNVPGHGQVPVLVGTEETSLPEQLDPQTFAPRAGLQNSPISVRTQVPDGTGWGPFTELVMNHPAQNVSSDFLPDGSTANATFPAVPPAGTDGRVPPPSGIETKVTTTLSGRGLDLTIAATNHNDTPRALAISWHAHFAAPRAGLTGMIILPPEAVTPSASIGSAASRAAARTVPLGAGDVHQVFTNLKYSYLSQGPEMRLRNAADGYVLRMTAMTPSIRSMRVDAAKDGKGVAIDFSTASGDSPERARTVVAPHETLLWRVRVDVPSDPDDKSSTQ